MTFRAVLFDLDDTLVDRAAAVRATISAQLEVATGEPLRRVAARLGGTSPPLAAWRRAIAHHARAAADAVDLLRHLRARGCVIVVVSNGAASIQRTKLARSGLAMWVDQVHISGEYGAPKPSPAMLQRALSQAGVSRDEALVVGDDPHTDIAAAHSAGIPSFWIAHGRSYPTDAPPPTHGQGSLRQLAETLGC